MERLVGERVRSLPSQPRRRRNGVFAVAWDAIGFADPAGNGAEQLALGLFPLSNLLAQQGLLVHWCHSWLGHAGPRPIRDPRTGVTLSRGF